YVDITRRMMAQWGVHSTLRAADPQNVPNGSPPLVCHIPAGRRYAAQSDYLIEPDASSASYFFAAAALTGGRVTIPGLGPDGLQGDVRFATEVLAEMGCEISQGPGGLTVRGAAAGRLRGVTRGTSPDSGPCPTV